MNRKSTFFVNDTTTLVLRIYSISVVCFVLFSGAIISAFAQTPTNQSLVLNQPTEHEIKGGESQLYVVHIGANQTASVEIIQKGIDVSLAAYLPNGEKFVETESPSGVLGNDLILVTAVDAGEYKIAIEPANPKASIANGAGNVCCHSGRREYETCASYPRGGRQSFRQRGSWKNRRV